MLYNYKDVGMQRRTPVIIMGGASHARPKILSRQRRLLSVVSRGSPNRRSREKAPLFARLRHFQARERRLLMVSDGARKTQAVVRMYHNSVFLGDTTFRKGLV